jgi:ZIP family zinc transporter
MFEPNVLIAFFVTILAASATMLGALAMIGAKESNPRLLAFGLSFAGGAMVYISLVEIFVKSQISFGEVLTVKEAYSAATFAFFVGIALLFLLDKFIPNPHSSLSTDENSFSQNKRKDDHTHIHADVGKIGLMATLAITAHNIPEGMATFFSTLDNPAVGMNLALAIAIHNIPEGLSIAIPVFYATRSKAKAVLATFVSAIAEPIGAFLGYVVLAPFIGPTVYGCVFGVIAGAMVYLALDELLPAAKRYAKGHETVYGIISGMAIIALSLVMFK